MSEIKLYIFRFVKQLRLTLFIVHSRIRNSHIQWQSQTAHRPSSLKKLAHWRHANIISPTLEDATDTRRACRHNDDLAHNHRVRTEGKRFIQLEHERLWHQFCNFTATSLEPLRGVD